MASSRFFTFLGTGTSVGVPMIGCNCKVCRSDNPKNHRYRSSAMISTDAGNILIDTSPELRLQLIRQGVGIVHAVLYTHFHADHIFGLDDLRPIPRLLGSPVPLYCVAEVEGKIRNSFSYAFGPGAELMSSGFIPKLTFQRITSEPFTVLGQKVIPIPLEHAHFDVFGFRIGDLAYCTDVSHIPGESMNLLRGIRILIIDALRHDPHPAHFGLNQALDVISSLQPEVAYLTHMSHELDYDVDNRRLPRGVAMAYDTLQFEF